MKKSIAIYDKNAIERLMKHNISDYEILSSTSKNSIDVLTKQYGYSIHETLTQGIIERHGGVRVDVSSGICCLNMSRFAKECRYFIIKLYSNKSTTRHNIGVRVEYECLDDDFVLKTLKHGKRFFFC